MRPGIAQREEEALPLHRGAGFEGVTAIWMLRSVNHWSRCLRCVAGILLLACLNLASLLMARGAARERELATRLAMGATRVRLIQQLLMESLLIAVMGTATGLAVAPLCKQGTGDDADGRRSRAVHMSIPHWICECLRLLLWTAVTAALLIGLVPALQATSGI